jgi:uncharacterized protein (DUF4213/DUF364 family)
MYVKTKDASVNTRIMMSLTEPAREANVSDVRIGLGYTAVMLEDGRAGVAFTFRKEMRGGCSVFHGLRPICGRRSSDLVPLLASDDPVEAAVGLACVNALTNITDSRFLGGDIMEYLDLRPEDDVGMVGNFGPLVNILKERARSLTVFERVNRPRGLLRPAEEAEDALPRCQVALITATSIINHSIDKLLTAAASCREVVVLGASTPLLPDAFRSENVTLLCGVVVNRPAELLQVVSEGGGMRLFSPYVNKVCLRCDRADLS